MRIAIDEADARSTAGKIDATADDLARIGNRAFHDAATVMPPSAAAHVGRELALVRLELSRINAGLHAQEYDLRRRAAAFELGGGNLSSRGLFDLLRTSRWPLRMPASDTVPSGPSAYRSGSARSAQRRPPGSPRYSASAWPSDATGVSGLSSTRTSKTAPSGASTASARSNSLPWAVALFVDTVS